ncbi:unnamed protein product [Paramecium sonneborni]|uniref:Uncharacterized protein n=1 Tax=Paramecium sonneborni TaxID=65129 RepID=A0A8S1LWL0_9CILI|nr:unnamed protein product [Paramecium sonneborni]
MEKTITIIFFALLAIEFFRPQKSEEQWVEDKEQILSRPSQRHIENGKVEVLVQYCTS